MNLKSAAPGETRPTLSLHKQQIFHWFHDNQGREYSPMEKPLDTPKHQEARKQWVRKWYHLLVNKSTPVAFIDKKWFYTTNCRRKVKRLPLGPNEVPGSDFIPVPKVRSRRFPVKSMFMGVIGRP